MFKEILPLKYERIVEEPLPSLKNKFKEFFSKHNETVYDPNIIAEFVDDNILEAERKEPERLGMTNSIRTANLSVEFVEFQNNSKLNIKVALNFGQILLYFGILVLSGAFIFNYFNGGYDKDLGLLVGGICFFIASFVFLFLFRMKKNELKEEFEKVVTKIENGL